MKTTALPYVQSFQDRHGKLRAYFRKGDIKIPLRTDDPLSFRDDYLAACKKFRTPASGRKLASDNHDAQQLMRHYKRLGRVARRQFFLALMVEG